MKNESIKKMIGENSYILITPRKDRRGSRSVETFNLDPTRTQQQFKDEVDVNNIMKKYIDTGVVTHLNQRSGRYADLTTAKDYFESMNVIAQAGEAFDQLPATMRKRFDNDPAKLLEFIHDPNNYDEGVKLGLFDPTLPAPGQPDGSPTATPKNDELNDEQKSATKKTK